MLPYDNSICDSPSFMDPELIAGLSPEHRRRLDRGTSGEVSGIPGPLADGLLLVFPVGVLRERAPASRSSRYDVLGLATPMRWSEGYFYFESLDPRAVPAVDPVNDVLEATASAEVDQESPLEDAYDARLRVYR